MTEPRQARTLPIVAPRDEEDADGASPDRQRARAETDLCDEDLHDLLVDFYDRVAADELLAPYFAVVDMRAHLPRIVDFWSTLLFHSGRYSGNAFRPHLEMPGLTSEHFANWLAVLESTVNDRVAGPAAEYMKALAHRIAYSMQLRLGITPFEGFRPLPDPER